MSQQCHNLGGNFEIQRTEVSNRKDTVNGYRIISHDAVRVLAGLISIELLTLELVKRYQENATKQVWSRNFVQITGTVGK